MKVDELPLNDVPSPQQVQAISVRMAEKQLWKKLPGNRYTPEELEMMSQHFDLHLVEENPNIIEV